MPLSRLVLAAEVVAGLFLLLPAAGARELAVELHFNRLPRIASNQFAVWVEDSAGDHVKTLFVTDFTAHRQGYRRRPAVVPAWVRAFTPASRPAAETDAVSGATPRSGLFSVTWDCTDEKGRPVVPGAYRLRVEGNLFWESVVSFDLPFELGGKASSVVAEPSYSSPKGAEDLRMITNVRLSYRP